MRFLKENQITLVAEIGVNHEGNIETAKKLLKLAASTGVDYVKFQSYTPERYASANDSARLQRVTKFALSEENFVELANIAKDLKVGFLSTPLTEDWVDSLDKICPAFKIASGDITFKEVIQKVARTKKDFMMSTGGATIEEIDCAVSWVKDEIGTELTKKNLIVMHCVSAYPTPIEEANVLAIPFLKERYGVAIGYSNHVIGMNACLAAIGAGAEVIEIHFTDQKHDREFRDHSLSFDYNDMTAFVKIARDMYKSLGQFTKQVQPCELSGIPAMRKGLVAARDLKAGVKLSVDDLAFARPATQFLATDLQNVLGKLLRVDVAKGFLIPKDAV